MSLQKEDKILKALDIHQPLCPWVFPLQSPSRRTEEYHLGEYIKQRVEDLLKICFLTKGGERVHVDGFRLLNDPIKEYPLNLSVREEQDEKTALFARSEPRIRYIRNRLQSLLQVVDLFQDQKSVEVDSFRLKNLSNFLSPTQGLFINLSPLAYGCNLNCVFCFAKFYLAEPGIPKRLYKTMVEIKDRIAFYRPKDQKGLPRSGNLTVPWEPFIHPRLLDIIHLVHQKAPQETIDLDNTNGSFLTQDMVDRLTRYKKVLRLTVSLNSCRTETRNRIMRDKKPRIAIEGVRLLGDRNFHFSISIVALPMITGMEDLEETIWYADQCNPVSIRINLPTYTRHSPKEIKCTEQEWLEIVALVRRLRGKVRSPLLFIPALFGNDCGLEARIEGVAPESIGGLVGLQSDDRIIEIEGETIQSRTHALKMLRHYQAKLLHFLSQERLFLKVRLALLEALADKMHKYPLRIKVKRGNNILSFNLTEPLTHREVLSRVLSKQHVSFFPLDREPPDYVHPFGICLPSDFDFDTLEDLRNIISRREAKRVLVMSSRLVRPLFEKAMEKTEFQRKIGSHVQLYISVPENAFFGGNVIIGDLLVVSDFINEVRRFVSTTGIIPDLLIIPSSPFNPWGLDLCGHSYLEIETSTGIDVELIYCTRVAY